ncbi:MAG: hypothetical protein ACRBN8_39900 [Nannocystales bacterium]
MRTVPTLASLLLFSAPGCGEERAPSAGDSSGSAQGVSSSESTVEEVAGLDETSTGNPALPGECGNGVVEGTEMCDGGEDCDDRCRVSGAVIWTWDTEQRVQDLAAIGERVVVCGRDGMTLLDVAAVDGESLDTEGEVCVRVASGAGGFAAITVADVLSPEVASLRVFDTAGVGLWGHGNLGYDGFNSSRAAVSMSPDDEVVISSASGNLGRFRLITRYGANGAEIWSRTVEGDESVADVNAIALAGDGGVAVAGNAAQHGLYLAVLGSKGETLFSMTESYGAMVDEFREVARMPDGRLAAIGIFSPTHWVGVVNPPQTEFAWITDITPAGSAADILVHPSGELIVLHNHSGGTQLSAFDSEGAPGWSMVFPDTGMQASGVSFVMLPNEDMAVALNDTSGTGRVVGIAGPRL